MDNEIEFGEVEHVAPDVELRPDQNRHFAVVPYDDPEAADLPIYVDLDVLRDMEAHAQTDTSVELGGVMLGGQYEDEDGNAFVIVTDSLRAQHYESTKGSFKFTHDTWSEITRQRNEFPDELQMVGWYHTHPDWGVFLSGMDMFICDNFFNRELDIALVIDPCRLDRGMFHWTGRQEERIRRTGGFYLMASRFREAELAAYAEQLKGEFTMAQHPSGYPAPIVNVHESSTPQWQSQAILGLLGMQFLLVALIAFKFVFPGSSDTKTADKLDKMASVMDEFYATQAKARAQEQVLEQTIKSLGQGKKDASYMVKLQTQINSLVASHEGLSQRAASLKNDIRGANTKIKKQDKAIKKLKKDNLDLGEYKKKWDALKKKEKKSGDKKEGDADEDGKGLSAYTLYIGGGLIALAAILAIGMTYLSRKEEDLLNAPEPDFKDSPSEPDDKVNE